MNPNTDSNDSNDAENTQFVDDRAKQTTLGTADPTQHRESKTAEGSEKFADDRESNTSGSAEQSSLCEEKVGNGQQSLTGDDATTGGSWADESGESDDDETRYLGDVYGPTMKRPVPDSERAEYTHYAEPIDSRELSGTALSPRDIDVFTNEIDSGTHRDDWEPRNEYEYQEAVEAFESSDESTDPNPVEAAENCSHPETREIINTNQYGKEGTKHVCESCNWTVKKHLGTNQNWCEHCTFEAPEAIESADRLPGGFEFKGTSEKPHMADDEETPEPVGEFYYWKKDSKSMVGVYENDQYAADGYGYTAAKWVNPIGGNPFWKYTHIAETWADAVKAAERLADHRTYITESNSSETYTDWEDRTGGTSYTPSSTLGTVDESEDSDESDDAPAVDDPELRVWEAEKTFGLKAGDWVAVCKPGEDPTDADVVKIKYDRAKHLVLSSGEYLKSSPSDGIVRTPDPDAPFWDCIDCDVHHVDTADDRPAKPYWIGETVRFEFGGGVMTGRISGTSVFYDESDVSDDDRNYLIRIRENYGGGISVSPSEIIETVDESDDSDEITAAIRPVESDGETTDNNQEIATDGGQQLPENETVRLITGIVGVMHSPEIVEGKTSGTGKTISVDDDRRATVRLDTADILAGEDEYRESTYFEIYTPKRLQNLQRTNNAPGPQAGANGVSDAENLPEPTHVPEGEEAYPEPHEEDDDQEEDDSDETTDPLDMQTWKRADVFAVEGVGELLITRTKGRMATTHAEAVDRRGDEFTVRTFDSMGEKTLLVESEEDSGPVVMVDETERYTADEIEYTGQSTDWLRRWIRNQNGDEFGGDDSDGGGGGSDDRPDNSGDTPRVVTDGGRDMEPTDEDEPDEPEPLPEPSGASDEEVREAVDGIGQSKCIETDGGRAIADPLRMDLPLGWEVDHHLVGGNVDIDGRRETAVFLREDGARVWVETMDDSDKFAVRSILTGAPGVEGRIAADLDRTHAYLIASQHMEKHSVDTVADRDPVTADGRGIE